MDADEGLLVRMDDRMPGSVMSLRQPADVLQPEQRLRGGVVRAALVRHWIGSRPHVSVPQLGLLSGGLVFS